jgi:hypothetical protein
MTFQQPHRKVFDLMCKFFPHRIQTMLGAVMAVTVLTVSPVFAQSRANTTQISCQVARGIVSANGSAVLNTGPNSYDRYVRDQSACFPLQTTRPAWVPSADTAQCFVGYTCQERERSSTR